MPEHFVVEVIHGIAVGFGADQLFHYWAQVGNKIVAEFVGEVFRFNAFSDFEIWRHIVDFLVHALPQAVIEYGCDVFSRQFEGEFKF